MVKDYSVYELSIKERIRFLCIGYMCIFVISYLFYRIIWLSLLSGTAVHWLIPYFKKHMAVKRMDRRNIQFKDLLYSLSSSVASGRQMDEALIEAVDELSVMYDEDELIMKELRHMKISMLQNKESDKVLLKDFAFRSKSEDINNFVQVYITCRNMGGNLEKIISHTTEILTDKMSIDREIRAIMAQKKTEGRIISVMPFVMLLMLNFFSYAYIEPLYTTVAGRIIMSASLAATIYGIYMMEKISSVRV